MKDLFAQGNGHTATNGRHNENTIGADDLAALDRYMNTARRRLADDNDIARRARDYAHRFGLTDDDAVELGLGLDPGTSVVDRPTHLRRFNGPPRLVVPFYNVDGTIGGCQGRAIVPVDDNRTKRWESPLGKGWARVGYFAIENPDPVLITEGPSDALTAAAAGYAAAAVRGASLYGPVTAEDIARDLAGRLVVIAGDDDPPGRKFSDRLSINLRAKGLRTATLDQIPGGDLTAWREHAGDQFTAQLEEAVAVADVVDPPTPPGGELEEPPPAFDGPDQRRYTDAGNALRLVDQHGADIRYVGDWARWLAWDGTRWERDANLSIIERAKAVAEHMHIDAIQLDTDSERKTARRFAKATEAAARLRAMVDLARSDPRVATSVDVLDLDQWLLNVANGTIDLRTGQMRPHDRQDLVTKKAAVAYDPDAECPQWTAFLNRIMDGDDELVAFLQRAVGYSLTGSVREQCLMLLYGAGANGKTTFLTTVMTMLGVGEYALKTPTDTLVARREGVIPNDLARLRGARFVYASETEAGARLAESMVKDLTGGDVISARFMRGEWFDFTPVCKLWLSTNHRPVIRGTDEAIWRRIRLVPFTVTIPEDERDPELDSKLEAELDGILAWAVRGCLEWQRVGLGLPGRVADATAGYRREMDVIGQFIGERFLVDQANPAIRVQSKALYEAYREWCDETGEHVLSQRALGDRLREKGFESFRSGGKWWRGLGLKDVRTVPDQAGEEGSKVPPMVQTEAEAATSAADDANAPAENGTLEPSGTFPPVNPHAHARATRAHTRTRMERLTGNKVPEGSKVPTDEEEQGEWEV